MEYVVWRMKDEAPRVKQATRKIARLKILE